MAAATVCKKNQFSHCKFGRFCYFKHENKKCNNLQCQDRSCIFRHPASCRNILQGKPCPWGSSCSFDHGVKISCEVVETSANMLKKKIDDLENIVKLRDIEIQRLKSTIVEVSASLDQSIETETDVEVEEIDDEFTQCSDFEPTQSNNFTL